MVKGFLKATALMLFAFPAFAGVVTLKAPAYPWEQGVAHSNVTHAFVTGFDSAGNPEGICTYYNSRGFPVYAYCGWDLAGQPVYATPAQLTPYQVSKLLTYGAFGTYDGIRGWLQADENGSELVIAAPGTPGTSVLITP